MFAVIRLRGDVKTPKTVKDTLKMMRLKTVNNCVIIPENESYKGMLKKAKDYITWGEITTETLQRLVLKWGRIEGDKRLDEKYLTSNKFDAAAVLDGKATLDGLKLKGAFRLHPPSKGYEGIKNQYTQGGSLGYRGKEINELLQRMI
jgi:large subunit ribosomal protein L30